MVSAYLLLKWVHVLLAITAVGFNISYALLIARASREPRHLGHVLRTVKFMDDYVANPAFALLLVTGLAMVWVARLSLGASWLQLSLVLYGFLAVLGLFGYTPTLRKQIRALETDGAASPAYRRLATRGTVLGAILGALVLAILYLMVVKPTF